MAPNGRSSPTFISRLESALEPAATHGSGAVLDVFVWGTARRARAPSDVVVREVADHLAAIARDALPRAEPGIRVDHLPLERALFESKPGGPDEIRIAFRVSARSRSELSTWRAHLHENLRAIGVRGGEPGAVG